MLTIDGSIGEGGGQVLRTALGLSLVTGRPFRILNIRSNRRKPGLLPQHVTSVSAAAAIGQAAVEGGKLGARELSFTPGKVVAGDYHFAVGSAGSATLVLQAILPALITAKGTSSLVLEGGTHNPFAPPFDFLQKAFLPLLARMGPRVEMVLERPGFFPAGGGRMRVTIRPAERLRPMELVERGEVRECRAQALLSKLPQHIAERELAVLRAKLGLPEEACRIEVVENSPGPGNAVMIEVESESLTEVFSSFGQRGLPAEKVAEQAVAEAASYLRSGVPVGEHLADQLLMPLAMAGGGSFLTLPLTSHSRTNMDVIRQFLAVDFEVTDQSDATAMVRVKAMGVSV